MAKRPATFDLMEQHLAQLCEFNSFEVPDGPFIFFGLRGLTPTKPDDAAFRASQRLKIAKVDYVSPRCTIGQWNRVDGTFAVFPGSTVPAAHLFRPKVADNRRGANQVITGYYRFGYAKGLHPRGATGSQHEAFRQQGTVAIRRIAGDDDYDADDRVEVESPADHLHAAWVSSVTDKEFSSLGCQVVVGLPDSEAHTGNSGPWKEFKEVAYAQEQTSFPYLLLDGIDAQRIATGAGVGALTRLRFGSSGELVEHVQRALGVEADGKFGHDTLMALLGFQKINVGPRSDTGIVDSRTAAALGLMTVWPGPRTGRRPRRKPREMAAAEAATVLVSQWATQLSPRTLQRSFDLGLFDGKPADFRPDGGASSVERQELTKTIIASLVQRLDPASPPPGEDDLVARASEVGLFQGKASFFAAPPLGKAKPDEREHLVRTIINNGLQQLAPETDWAEVPLADRRVHVIELLTDRYGYPVEGAAGIVGNLDVESGVLPSRLEGSSSSTPLRSEDNDRVRRDWTPDEVMNRIPGERGPRRPGVGLAQWTHKDRREGLFNHEFDGTRPGADILFSMEAQVDYLVAELARSFKTLDQLLRKESVTVDEAAAEVVYDFERPGSVIEVVDGRARRRLRDDPQVLKVFAERSERAHKALDDLRRVHG